MPAIIRGLLGVIFVLVLSGCQEDGPRASQTLSTVPDLVAAERALCERTGGRWGARAGGNVFTCYRETRDANQLCSSASDCESVCLARSRTCAPITPFLGCHEILTIGGQPATECLN